MIKEAMAYLAALKEESMKPIVMDINGKTYCNKDLKRYDNIPMASSIESATLTAMVDYIKNRREELAESMIIHISSPTHVELYSGLNRERRREPLFQCGAIVQEFRFDRIYDQERFVIELQANFRGTPDLEAILKVSGNIEAKTTANYGDDGVSQKATIKSGIATNTDVIVPNPVSLMPYRTFLEVEQPVSNFVFRIVDEGGKPGFKLVEAEGGLWKIEAMKNVKRFLEDKLKDIPRRETITIIA